jgi:hypothetical protein
MLQTNSIIMRSQLIISLLYIQYHLLLYLMVYIQLILTNQLISSYIDNVTLKLVYFISILIYNEQLTLKFENRSS